jgi:MFS transporter, PPP family, 3-phenylpropionic acid transporter
MPLSSGTRVALFFAAIFAASAVSSGFLPLFFADRGLSPGAIGRVLGLAALLRVLAGPAWGNVADRIGRRRHVLCTAGIAATLASLAFVPASGFLGFLAVASVQGVAAAALGPLVDSLALALARAQRLEYGPVRSAGSAAYMVASAITGRLLSVAGTALLPFLLFLTYAAASTLSLLLPEAEVPRAAARPLAGLRLFALPPFRLTVAASALIQGAHAAYYGFAPLFWRAQGFSDTLIGLLIAEAIVAEVLLFAKGRALVERLGPAGLTGCAAAASVVRWSVTGMASPLPVLAAVQLLHAATFAMQHLSAMLMLSRSVPPERAATAQALHAALGMGAPTGLMMLLCGWMYARSSGLAFLAMASCGGAALLLVVPLARAARVTR